ncbi:hydroxypyruvate isomerase family protein [Phaeobacter marinintestinus]|uniref:hydroxypyruvate isomerase family protein n=1 Tax=Falsiphaeobacter marinintestinus TaxID=1492905 RepID=UPI0011B77887|nr:TIM barrel protein [Phaeobacter marinintestinus]
MARFSANLGFLWTEHSLPDAIRAAARAGFDAVECHWPYDVPIDEVRSALADTGLQMLGINTMRGTPEAPGNGMSAVPDLEAQARAAIRQAVEYAAAIGAHNIHVMAGVAAGDAAQQCFLTNLQFACDLAAPHGIAILIEPLNPFDAPGYFLSSTEQAASIIALAGRNNLKLMFDFYHVERTEGNALGKVENLLPVIGHIQFAAVPDRGAPDHGALDYGPVFDHLDELGYTDPLGAEYKPDGATEDSLGWLNAQKQR